MCNQNIHQQRRRGGSTGCSEGYTANSYAAKSPFSTEYFQVSSNDYSDIDDSDPEPNTNEHRAQTLGLFLLTAMMKTNTGINTKLVGGSMILYPTSIDVTGTY